MFAVQYSMDDETDGAGNINWSNLLNAPKGPYGGDGFFLPSQNLINAYKTDNYGLPLFDTFTPMTMEYTKEVSSPTLMQLWILVGFRYRSSWYHLENIYR